MPAVYVNGIKIVFGGILYEQLYDNIWHITLYSPIMSTIPSFIHIQAGFLQGKAKLIGFDVFTHDIEHVKYAMESDNREAIPFL